MTQIRNLLQNNTICLQLVSVWGIDYSSDFCGEMASWTLQLSSRGDISLPRLTSVSLAESINTVDNGLDLLRIPSCGYVANGQSVQSWPPA